MFMRTRSLHYPLRSCCQHLPFKQSRIFARAWLRSRRHVSCGRLTVCRRKACVRHLRARITERSHGLAAASTSLSSINGRRENDELVLSRDVTAICWRASLSWREHRHLLLAVFSSLSPCSSRRKAEHNARRTMWAGALGYLRYEESGWMACACCMSLGDG